MLERFIEALKVRGFLQRGGKKTLADLTGYSAGSISDILSGKTPLGDKFLRIACERLSISEEWIRTGKGEMDTDSSHIIWMREINRIVDTGYSKTPQYRVDENTITPPANRPSEAMDIPRPTGKIPIISWAQAGPDGFFEDSFPTGAGFGEINRPYDVTDPNAYALIVSGDSMSPKFEPGDIILVSPNIGVRTGDYAVVKLKDGTVAAKRVKFKGSHFFLESINPDYEPIRCPAEEIVFLHRIVWVKQRG